MCREIKECFESLSTDPDCRVIMLTGAGKNFTAGMACLGLGLWRVDVVLRCVGLDLQEFAPKLLETKGGDGARNAMKLQIMIRSLQDSISALEKVGQGARP